MVIFLHGFLGDPRDFDALISYLPFPCKALPIDAPINEPCTLIGYSMGGRVALAHKKRAPHLIKKVICISTNPGIVDKPKRLQEEEEWLHFLENKGVLPFLQKWYKQPLFKTLTAPKWREELTKETIIKQLTNYSIARTDPLLEVPADYVFGSLDTKYLSLAKKLNGTMIEGAGHAVHLEAPRKLSSLIENFC